MKYPSKQAAVESVQNLFRNTQEDIISVQEAYIAGQRDLVQEEKNRGWLSNKLVDLKYHRLITPIYAVKNHRKTLDKIQLTLEGKRALGRADNTVDAATISQAIHGSNTLSIADVMKIVAKLRKENPDYTINFDVRLKNG